MYACMHMHAYILHLHPDMKIIKIKASDLYENKIDFHYACHLTSSERSKQGKFLLIILP